MNLPANTDFLRHTWMPEFIPPWKQRNPELPARGVRPDYEAGTWAYATGYPAASHKKYGTAVDLFRKATPNVTPWWIRSVADVEAVLHGCVFDPTRGLRVLRFLRRLIMSDGEWVGKHFTPLDWQIYDLIMPVYSWIAPDGLRRFTKVGLWIPKKNGKTGGAAGLGLYHLRGEKTGSPYVFIAATDRHQCGLMYKEARNMVENTPDLCEECHPVGGDIAGIKKILYRERNGEFEALSQDDKAKEGLRATAGFLDELHVLKKETFSSLSGSGGAATEPLLWTLSTAGQYDPKSIGWEQWSYGLKIQSGTIINDSFYALMYRATPHEDNPAWWLDFNEAKRANPSIGSILKTRYIKERIETARTNANELNDVLRYNFNVWVHQRNALISMQEWGACASALSADAFRESLLGRECFGGLDLSLSDDLTAFALWFPPRKADEPHKILVDFFLPRMHVEDRDTDGGAYMDWADAGYMHLTEGPTVDYSYVRQIIEERYKEFSIQEMGFDKYNATETSQKLMELYGESWCVEVPQSMMHMGPATRYVKELIQNRKIEHPDHPILNYHVSNAQGLYNPTGLYMITKSDKRTRLKVDGFVAVIIAGSRALTRPAPQQSAYTSRGVLSLADIRAQIESEKANC